MRLAGIICLAIFAIISLSFVGNGHAIAFGIDTNCSAIAGGNGLVTTQNCTLTTTQGNELIYVAVGVDCKGIPSSFGACTVSGATVTSTTVTDGYGNTFKERTQGPQLEAPANPGLDGFAVEGFFLWWTQQSTFSNTITVSYTNTSDLKFPEITAFGIQGAFNRQPFEQTFPFKGGIQADSGTVVVATQTAGDMIVSYDYSGSSAGPCCTIIATTGTSTQYAIVGAATSYKETIVGDSNGQLLADVITPNAPNTIQGGCNFFRNQWTQPMHIPIHTSLPDNMHHSSSPASEQWGPPGSHSVQWGHCGQQHDPKHPDSDFVRETATKG